MGLAENVRTPSYEGGVFAQKTVIWYLNVPCLDFFMQPFYLGDFIFQSI